MAAHGSLIRLRPRSDTQYISQNRTVLATDRHGFVSTGAEGLFVDETRLISRLRCLVNGNLPTPIAVSNVEQHSSLGYYAVTPPAGSGFHDSGSGQMVGLSEQTIELRLSRSVGRGLHEDIDVVNYSSQRTSFELAVELDADFADIVEADGSRQQHGSLQRHWSPEADGGVLRFNYSAVHRYDHQGDAGTARLERGVAVRVASEGARPRWHRGAVRFQIDLDPGQRWHACLLYDPNIDGEELQATRSCYALTNDTGAFAEKRLAFLRQSTRVSSGCCDLAGSFVAAFERAKSDLLALRLYDVDRGDVGWTLAAGVPLYVALFGRDTLVAAWQAALAGPEIMLGSLAELQKWQGTTVDDWRDEQPNRMLHEAHTGPLEVLNFNPRRRYYGSVTSSAQYGVVLAELWHWTGREDLVRPLVQPAIDALEWLDTWADMRHDGFYYYKTRSTQGIKNQGWKDSGDAIVYPDGSQVEPPIATAAEQGYVYGCKTLLAEILWWLDDHARAKRLYREAQVLKERFNETFWIDDGQFVAMALDGSGQPIRSIGSATGHSIATGILDERLVKGAADRLMAADLFSGWGIRTLSSDHPAYDPYSYHRGSVWPAEQGTFALGFFRYGLHDHLARLARALIESTELFEYFRLPEVFSGHARERTYPFPAFYPKSNAPQAWSSSAMLCVVQALLGIYPYAPLELLLIDPHLPEWLPQLTIERLRVGSAVVTIRFERGRDGTTSYELVEVEGPVHVIRQPSPWSLTTGFGERLKDALSSLLP